MKNQVQYANMRAGLAVVAGDEATHAVMEANVRAARARLQAGQTVVAPGCRVRGRNGVIEAGTLVAPGDLPDQVDEFGQVVERGPLIFRRLVLRGELLEAW